MTSGRTKDSKHDMSTIFIPLDFKCVCYLSKQADKPSSVVNGHLSRPIVTNRLKRRTKCLAGYHRTYCLAPGGVYICPSCYQEGGELLPHLSILTG